MTLLLAEDAALKTHLAGMTVSDEKNASRPVKVWFGYPDVEIRAQEFPFVTIDFLDMRQAVERQTSGLLVDQDYSGTIAPQSNKYYSYEVPVAYDLYYQITSYARHPRHDRAIIYQLNQKFPGMRGYLAVPNELGTFTAYRHMFLESFLKSDRAEGEHGNKRLLRNIYTIRVVSEMTPPPNSGTYIPGVTVVDINRNADGSWTASTVPPGFTVV
jgi:hypothetical protein